MSSPPKRKPAPKRAGDGDSPKKARGVHPSGLDRAVRRDSHPPLRRDEADASIPQRNALGGRKKAIGRAPRSLRSTGRRETGLPRSGCALDMRGAEQDESDRRRPHKSAPSRNVARAGRNDPQALSSRDVKTTRMGMPRRPRVVPAAMGAPGERARIMKGTPAVVRGAGISDTAGMGAHTCVAQPGPTAAGDGGVLCAADGGPLPREGPLLYLPAHMAGRAVETSPQCEHLSGRRRAIAPLIVFAYSTIDVRTRRAAAQPRTRSSIFRQASRRRGIASRTDHAVSPEISSCGRLSRLSSSSMHRPRFVIVLRSGGPRRRPPFG